MARSGILILTNCTNRKREIPKKLLRARTLKRGEVRATSGEWVSRLKKAPKMYVAKHLYCGRAVTETLEAANTLGASTAFISAGLGVVTENQRVPSYSLTASPGYPDSVGRRVLGAYDPTEWWRALSEAQSTGLTLKKLVSPPSVKLVLVAMPTSYMSMIVNELSSLSPRFRAKLRVIGPRRKEELPIELRSQWLPYNSRLDSPKSGMNGTASDFPHRALRHFALRVLGRNLAGSASAHAKDVDASLCRFKPYVRPRGRTATDTEVLRAIKGMWSRLDGRRNLMLRELRDKLRLACEQKRFQILANEFEESLLGSK
jgi:hypothetical protein